MNALGKLSWSAIPFNQPIPLGASVAMILAVLFVLGWITRKGLLEPVDSFNWDMADRCPWMAVTACEGGTTLPVEAERRSPPPAQLPSDV